MLLKKGDTIGRTRALIKTKKGVKMKKKYMNQDEEMKELIKLEKENPTETPYKIRTPHGIVHSSHPETPESANSYEAYYQKMILPYKKVLDSIDAMQMDIELD